MLPDRKSTKDVLVHVEITQSRSPAANTVGIGSSAKAPLGYSRSPRHLACSQVGPDTCPTLRKLAGIARTSSVTLREVSLSHSPAVDYNVATRVLQHKASAVSRETAPRSGGMRQGHCRPSGIFAQKPITYSSWVGAQPNIAHQSQLGFRK